MRKIGRDFIWAMLFGGFENAHFRKLFESYDDIDHRIYKIESNTDPKSDDALNKLRIDRVRLKDELYTFLKNN